MSRIGKLPIMIPDKVTVTINEQEVHVRGPLGELSHTFVPEVEIVQEENIVLVNRRKDDKIYRAMHGLSRSLLNNMIEGVSKGYEKFLLIVGVGYNAELKENGVLIRVGYSHPIWMGAPPGVTFEVLTSSQWDQYGIKKQIENQNVAIRITGISKQLVGQVAARMRRIRPPEPYKGKGIRYNNELVRRKAGKAAKK